MAGLPHAVQILKSKADTDGLRALKPAYKKAL